jgi:hypothetical protein
MPNPAFRAHIAQVRFGAQGPSNRSTVSDWDRFRSRLAFVLQGQLDSRQLYQGEPSVHQQWLDQVSQAAYGLAFCSLPAGHGFALCQAIHQHINT